MPTGSSQQRSASRTRVLVIDSSRVMLAMSQRAFEAAGFEIEVADSVAEWVWRHGDAPVDVILIEEELYQRLDAEKQERLCAYPVYRLFSGEACPGARGDPAGGDRVLCKDDGILALVAAVASRHPPGGRLRG